MTSLEVRFPNLDPDIARVLDVAASGTAEQTVVEARSRVRSANASALPGPDMAVVRDGRIGSVAVREYRSEASDKLDVVLIYLHGGGWFTGDLDYSDAICREIAARSGVRVVSVDYRLAPESLFPAALDDVDEVVRELTAASEFVSVVLMGDSAGANLAAALSSRALDDPQLRVVAQVLVYPVLDDDLSRHSYEHSDGLVLSRAKMTWFMDAYCPDQRARTSKDFAPLESSVT